MYKEGGGGFNTRCELVHILEQVIDWLFLNCRLRIKSLLCGNHFFFSLQQNMDTFLFSYPLLPLPPKKREKKRKKERKIQRKREHVNEILIILIFLNVVLNIEIIFVTGQGYIMLIYRRVKLINQNRAFFFFLAHKN